MKENKYANKYQIEYKNLNVEHVSPTFQACFSGVVLYVITAILLSAFRL